jgi:IclR family mhp operon transcriptional activator
LSNKYNLISLKRGLKALSLLNARDAVTASELAAEIGLPRTTARRVLDTLAEEGYVEKIVLEHKYRITPMVNMLSSGFSDESWIAHVAEPLLASKTLELGWPLSIATQAGEEMMVRVSTDRLTPLALDHFSIGFRTPMLHGTSGHVMLAFMSASHRELMLKILERSPDPRQGLARDPERLRSMLASVKAQGFAHVIYSEYPEASVSVPIFRNGVARAALLMHYVKSSIRPAQVRAEYVPMLQALAGEIQTMVRKGTRPSPLDGVTAARLARPTAAVRVMPRPVPSERSPAARPAPLLPTRAGAS